MLNIELAPSSVSSTDDHSLDLSIQLYVGPPAASLSNAEYVTGGKSSEMVNERSLPPLLVSITDALSIEPVTPYTQILLGVTVATGPSSTVNSTVTVWGESEASADVMVIVS